MVLSKINGAADIPKGSQLYWNNPLCVLISTRFFMPPPVEFVDMHWPDPVLKTTCHLPVMQTGPQF